MPYKSDNIKLPEKYDRRRKLTSEQKEEIKELYATGSYSLNKLAKMYEVSKKTILLIVNKESKRKNDEYIKAHWKEFQLDKDTHNVYVRDLRRYKHRLHKEGKI